MIKFKFVKQLASATDWSRNLVKIAAVKIAIGKIAIKIAIGKIAIEIAVSKIAIKIAIELLD